MSSCSALLSCSTMTTESSRPVSACISTSSLTVVSSRNVLVHSAASPTLSHAVPSRRERNTARLRGLSYTQLPLNHPRPLFFQVHASTKRGNCRRARSSLCCCSSPFCRFTPDVDHAAIVVVGVHQRSLSLRRPPVVVVVGVHRRSLLLRRPPVVVVIGVHQRSLLIRSPAGSRAIYNDITKTVWHPPNQHRKPRDKRPRYRPLCYSVTTVYSGIHERSEFIPL